MYARLRSFLIACTRREGFEDSLDEEVRFHLDACAEDLVRESPCPPSSWESRSQS